jgi:histidine triad (HIT) family protein
MDCLFCKIIAGQIPVERIYEDEHVLAFPDIHPQAPVHVLIVPKQHFASIADVTEGLTVGNLMAAAVKVAGQEGIGLRKDGGGYRLVINTGPDGGQTVHHLHVHLLGGRAMGWPPG